MGAIQSCFFFYQRYYGLYALFSPGWIKSGPSIFKEGWPYIIILSMVVEAMFLFCFIYYSFFGGNKARLIAAIHYNTSRVYIRYVLTHKEYDRGTWKEK